MPDDDMITVTDEEGSLLPSERVADWHDQRDDDPEVEYDMVLVIKVRGFGRTKARTSTAREVKRAVYNALGDDNEVRQVTDERIADSILYLLTVPGIEPDPSVVIPYEEYRAQVD